MPTETAAPAQPSRAAAPAVVAVRRLPVLVLGVVSLLAGLWGGLLLLGLSLPTLRGGAAAGHGPLMALGFLGTVISLERAVALRRGWAYAAPVLAGAGGIALLTGAPATLAWGLLCLASVVLVVACVVVHSIQPALHLKVMTVGAVCWYVATLLWLGGRTVPELVPWLVAWLVLTILGERLELARVVALAAASRRWFVAGSAVLVLGLVLTVPAPSTSVGSRLVGVGLLALALWGARHDVARRTIRIPGVTRFMAVCLLSGYAWLIVAGLTWLVTGDPGRTLATYDVALHAVFLGFVMAMIFGHAPVIVPAVIGARLPFTPWFYLHLAVLHVTLLVRLGIGGNPLLDDGARELAWRVGGVGTEVAVLLFLVASLTAVLRARCGAAKRVTQPRAVQPDEEARP